MVNNQKRVFWEALILSVFVFGVGVALGFFIESWRGEEITNMYTSSEVAFLDVRLQSEIYGKEITKCDYAVEQNANFGDRIYEEAKILDRYEGAQRLSNGLITQHKKYDLLRVSFWLNSMKIREECNSSYHTVIYFYKYNNPSIEEKAKQSVISNILAETKEELGHKIMLIPIAGDLNVSSIELMKNNYGIKELPSVLIDEKIVVDEKTSKEELIKILN
ncbi:MAG: hypothetical protein AABW73_05095 [Nanoarchaeota archaeon]